MIYLDHIAATPVDQRVLEAMLPYLYERFGSPLSLHRHAEVARQAIETARKQVARLINAQMDEIVFTANGTEADNLAIKGIARANTRQGQHIIVSSIEHHAVLYSARALEREGFSVTRLPVDQDGLVNPQSVRDAITDETVLISILHASDEVGTIQPIQAICTIAHERGILVHTDAICTTGVIPVDVQALNVDALSMHAQSMAGPKGIGALYIKEGTRIRPLIEGGAQESGRRGGHENIPAIVGFGQAAAIAQEEMPERVPRITQLRDRLTNGLSEKIGDVTVNGHPTSRLPGHINLMIRDTDSESMVLLLDAKGIAASIGSSCSSQASKPSHVLTAVGLTPREAQSSLLMTLGPTNTSEDVDQTIDILPEIVEKLREVAGVGAG